MKYSKIAYLLILVIPIFPGCGSDYSVSFNDGEWRSDHGGCKLKRVEIYRDLLQNQDELLGLNSGKIIRILGKPERNQLYRRNQKFFIYQISPSPECNLNYEGSGLYLFIRFNAVDRSQEIFIQDQPGLTD